MFPSDILELRAIENRPGITYDAARLSNLYAEDIELLADNIVAIEEYVLELPTTEQIIAYSVVL